jgi:hypothetical protein
LAAGLGCRQQFVSGVGTDFTGVFIAELTIGEFVITTSNRHSLVEERNRMAESPGGSGKADLRSFVDRLCSALKKCAGCREFGRGGSQFSASHTWNTVIPPGPLQLAKSLGKDTEYERLMSYSRGWEKLYDKDSGFIRPKDAAGGFITEFNPRRPWVGFQEGNAWQYTFYVPHDIASLKEKMGASTFYDRLEDVFSQPAKTMFGGGEQLDAFSGLENVYNHGNQPSLHIAWLFNYAGHPWRTQYWVRRICDDFYGAGRVHGYGFGQDEDQGQLGAWFVMATMGLFDVQGGTAPKPVFQLATPMFERIQINSIEVLLRRKFKVAGDPANPYIQSARMGGEKIQDCEIPWERVREEEPSNYRWGLSPARPGHSPLGRHRPNHHRFCECNGLLDPENLFLQQLDFVDGRPVGGIEDIQPKLTCGDG